MLSGSHIEPGIYNFVNIDDNVGLISWSHHFNILVPTTTTDYEKIHKVYNRILQIPNGL